MLIMLNNKFTALTIFNGEKMSLIARHFFFFFGGGEGRSIRHTYVHEKPGGTRRQRIFSRIILCSPGQLSRCRFGTIATKFMLLYLYICTLIFATLLSHFWSFRSKIWIHIRWRTKGSCFLWWSERCSCS